MLGCQPRLYALQSCLAMVLKEQTLLLDLIPSSQRFLEPGDNRPKEHEYAVDLSVRNTLI